MDKTDNKLDLFLSSMPKNFENFGIWRQDDTNDKKITKARKENIGKYNSAEIKFGIFFSPNGEYHKFEKLSDRTGGRCFAICASSSIKGFWDKFELTPSIVNVTIDRYDCFWLLQEPMAIDEFERLASDLESIYMIGFGKSVRDIYRIPGTIFWEDNKGQEKTLTVVYNEKKYSKQDFLNLVVPMKNIEIKANTARDMFQGAKKTQKQTYYTINNLDIFEVWKQLDDTYEYKEGVVYHNGTPTDIKYAKDYNWIYSPSEEDLCGNPFVLAKYYLKTQDKIYNFFVEKFGIGSVVDEQSAIISDDDEDEINGTTTITTTAGDIIFDRDDKSTDIMVKNIRTQIIDGYIKPIGYFIRNKIKICLVKYYKENGETGVIEFDSLGQTNRLDVMLSRNLLTYFGSSKVKKFIQSYIQSGKTEYTYIDKLGIYSKDLVINEAGNYITKIDGKKYYISIEDETLKVREAIFKYEDKVIYQDVAKQIEELKTMYKPSVISTMFTHFGLTMCSKGIHDLGFKIPLGILVGLTQSGKTYMRQLMMKLFGLTSNFEIQASTTAFVLIKKMRHYLPVNVGEYNTNELKFDRDHYMKTIYDGTNEMRGTSGQTLNLYESNSTLFIDGESKTTNNAVYSRGIVYFMNPRYRIAKDIDRYMAHGFKNILGYFIDNFNKIGLITDEIEMQRKIVNKSIESIDVQDKVRIASNYSLILAFAKVFGFYDLVSLDIIDQMHEQFKMMGDNNIDKTIKNVMTLAISNKMICDIDNRGILTIDFVVDILRYAGERIDEILSNIEIVNHHFGTKGDNSQTLGIPLEYIFKNKAIHILSNIILSMIYERSNEFNMTIARQVYQYAKENNYTKSPFYSIIETHPEFKAEHLPF